MSETKIPSGASTDQASCPLQSGSAAGIALCSRTEPPAGCKLCQRLPAAQRCPAALAQLRRTAVPLKVPAVTQRRRRHCAVGQRFFLSVSVSPPERETYRGLQEEKQSPAVQTQPRSQIQRQTHRLVFRWRRELEGDDRRSSKWRRLEGERRIKTRPRWI